MTNKFTIVGHCIETGQPVIAGIYPIYETHGIPLEQIFGALFRNGYRISIQHLRQEMKAAGVKPSRAESMMESAMSNAELYM